MNSKEINIRLGAKIVEVTGKNVNLTDPEITCRIEIMRDAGLVFMDRFKGSG